MVPVNDNSVCVGGADGCLHFISNIIYVPFVLHFTNTQRGSLHCTRERVMADWNITVLSNTALQLA